MKMTDSTSDHAVAGKDLVSTPPSQPIRVLLVSAMPPPIGGLQVWTKEYVDSAESNGVRVTLIDTASGGDRINARSRIRLSRVQQMLRSAIELWKALPGNDVAHLSNTWFWSLAREGLFAWMCRARRVPAVLHIHAATMVVDSLRDASTLRLRLLRLWLRPVSSVVVLSEELRDVLRGVLPGKKIEFVPNWVNTEKFSRGQQLASDEFRVLFVGRMTAEKGFFNIAEAVLQNDRLRLISLGDRPDRPTPEDSKRADELLAALAATGRHDLHPFTPHEQLPAMYRSANAFSLPSWNEGLPMSLLEAMASGLPCVITPVGGMGDLINRTIASPFGISVPIDDTPALSAALERLVHDRDLAETLGSAGRLFVENNNSMQVVFDLLKPVYATAIDLSDHQR